MSTTITPSTPLTPATNQSRILNHQVKVYITNGMARSGKDTFAKYVNDCLVLQGEAFRKLSTIQHAKDMCSLIGWNGQKDEKGRKFLSDVNLALEDYNDSPMFTTLHEIDHTFREYGYKYYFVDIREPYRIERFIRMCKAHNYQVKSIFIERPNNEQVLTNAGDLGTLEPFKYDFTIVNNGTLEDLKDKAVKFAMIEMLGIESFNPS